MKVKIICKYSAFLPEYKTPQSAGCDLHAVLANNKLLGPLDRVTIPTGLYVQLPEGYEAQVRPRSGLTSNYGLVAQVGTIDADYRGEIKVTVINLSNEDVLIKHGDRIAQLVIAKIEQAEWDEVDVLDETERGENGFGSTGII